MRISDWSSDVCSSDLHRAPPGATADQRAEMLDLAVAGEPGLAVDRRELRRDGRSYSIDTLLELRAELGGHGPVALLVGAESFVGLLDWHRWCVLVDNAHFVTSQRPGSPPARSLQLGGESSMDIGGPVIHF